MPSTATAAQRPPWTNVDEKLLAQGNDAKLMHPMPVRRNVEATDDGGYRGVHEVCGIRIDGDSDVDLVLGVLNGCCGLDTELPGRHDF